MYCIVLYHDVVGRIGRICIVLYHDVVGRIGRNDPNKFLVGEKLFAKLQKKPDKKTEVNISIMADMRKLGNLHLEFSQ